MYKDNNNPSRAVRKPGPYRGLFGPSASWEPMRLLFLVIAVMLIGTTAFAVYRETKRYRADRRQRKAGMLLNEDWEAAEEEEDLEAR